MSQTLGQKEAAADWHELMIRHCSGLPPQRRPTMRQSYARVSEQFDPRLAATVEDIPPRQSATLGLHS